MERVKVVKIGEFCKLLGDEVGEVKICLRFRGEELVQLHDPEEIDRPLDHVQGVSLAKVLETHRLSPKMKIVLAYILARSVWQFYNSDWMKTKWTSETIQFMPERDPAQKLYACKPCFAVQFDDAGDDFAEYCALYSVIHRYPRVLALGVLLIDIGRKTYLVHAPSEAVPLQRKINDDYVMAKKAFEDSSWPAFDGLTNKIVAKRYKAVVGNCFNRELFSRATFDSKGTNLSSEQGVEERRAILYERVVYPLHILLTGMGWTDALRNIEPLDPTSPPKTIPRISNGAPKHSNAISNTNAQMPEFPLTPQPRFLTDYPDRIRYV